MGVVDTVLFPGIPVDGRSALTRVHDGRLAPKAVALGATLLPILLPVGPVNTAPVDAMLLVGIGCTGFWIGSSRAPVRFPFSVGVMVFAIAGTLAALLGPLPLEGGLAVAQDLYLLAWCLAVANALRTPHDMTIFVRVWSWSATTWASILVIAVLTGHSAIAGVTQGGGSRASFTFGEQNGAAIYFVISLMVILAARCPIHRGGRIFASTIVVAAIVMTGSLAGLTGLLVAAATTAFLTVFDRRGPVPAVSTLAIIMLAGGLTIGLAGSLGVVEWAHDSQYSILRDSIGRAQQSTSEREVLAAETAGLYQTGGLVGRGPSSTEYSLRAIQAPYPKEAHNDYVATLVERGVLGALGVLILVGAVILRASGVWSAGRLAPPFRTVLPSPAFLIGGLVAIALSSVTHEVMHDRTAWTLLGLIAALSLWAVSPSTAARRRTA